MMSINIILRKVNKMAMNKKPKPLRPSGPTKRVTKYTIGTPEKPVVKVQPKKPITKSTVKNPSAPKGAGSGAGTGSVRVLTKSESLLKREKAMRERSGKLPLTKTVTDSMKTSGKKSYKRSTGNQRLIDDTQYVRRNPKGRNVSEMANNKAANKPKGVTPPKKTPPTPPKSRFSGRPGLRGFGGGSGLYGNMFKR
jgi:hypothetical protein